MTDTEMHPIVFGGMLGWLHAPRVAIAETGVVLLSPLGREAGCAYAPMRLFADQLAAAGYPTLRFDFRGAGDSLEAEDETADAVQAWIEQTELAVRELRARTEVGKVVLGGLRFGGSLAAVAEALGDGLILLAPVLNGRTWLNQLRFSDQFGNAQSRATLEPGSLETGGYWLSSATVRRLSEINLPSRPPRSGVPVFVAAQNRQVGKYAEALAEAGATVRVTGFDGFMQLFPDPARSLPPTDVFNDATSWMRETFGPPLRPRPAAEKVWGGQPVLQLPDSVERVVVFGEGLRGVLSTPAHPAPGAPALLFASTGGEPRAGVGRFSATTARRMAALGVASLRFDFAGLGDSDWPPSSDRCHVYETPREAEMDAAVALMAGQGHRSILCVGVCTGAYHSLRAAWRNRHVVGVFAASPIKIVWRDGDSITFGTGRYRHPLKHYVKAIFSVNSWAAELKRGVNPADLALVLAGRLRSRLLGWVARGAATSPQSQMARFIQRGGRACLVMGAADGSVEELETHFGSRGGKLARTNGLTIEFRPELDHSLSLRASRELATQVLTDWMSTSSFVPTEIRLGVDARALPERLSLA